MRYLGQEYELRQTAYGIFQGRWGGGQALSKPQQLAFTNHSGCPGLQLWKDPTEAAGQRSQPQQRPHLREGSRRRIR